MIVSVCRMVVHGMVLFQLFQRAQSDLLASSKIQHCVAEGGSNEEISSSITGRDTCQRKLVLTVTVSNTQQSSEWYTVSSAQDADGNEQDLALPYVQPSRHATVVLVNVGLK